MEAPIMSPDDVEIFTPPGSPRSYRIAPLTFRERKAFKARVTEEAGIQPSQHDLFFGMRAALAELNPANIDELRDIVSRAQALRIAQDTALAAGNAPAPLSAEDEATLGHCAALEASISTVPLYAALLNRREAHTAVVPYLAARFALRGWDGPGLPEFKREAGMVPEDILEALDRNGELLAVGWRSYRLAQPGSSAVGNFGSPLPSPETPMPAEAEIDQKTAASGGSRGKSGKATRAS